MRRVVAIAAVSILVFDLIVLHPAIKDFLRTRPWWHSLLLAVLPITLLILAYFELRHVGEINGLRAERNGFRAEVMGLQRRVANLTAELDAERSKHVQP